MTRQYLDQGNPAVLRPREASAATEASFRSRPWKLIFKWFHGDLLPRRSRSYGHTDLRPLFGDSACEVGYLESGLHEPTAYTFTGLQM
jgi:hypothetical protein